MNRITHRTFKIAAFLFLAALLIHEATRLFGPRHTADIDDPRRMTEIISKQIPTGTTIDSAQRFMESEGFKCSRTVNGAFGPHDGIDYIYCDRHDGYNLVQRRWQVAVIHRDGKVLEIVAATELVGP